MNAFDHFTPTSLSEALELLARFDGQGVVNAGGTDLMLKIKAGAIRPAAVINIKRLAELKGLRYDEDRGLHLGALTTLQELTRSPIIAAHYPCLATAAGLMASEQIRSFATVGGNMCNGAPSADLAPPLIGLGASAVIAGPAGERHLSLEEFFLGPGQTALKAGELLQAIHVPPAVGRTIYLKHAPRAFMDIAVVSVAAGLATEGGVCQRIRLVLGAVAPIPLRVKAAEAVLTGHELTADRLARTARIAAEASSPIDDVRGSGWYRRRMVEVLTRRSLEALLPG